MRDLIALPPNPTLIDRQAFWWLKEVEDRFWESVQQSEGCWLWEGQFLFGKPTFYHKLAGQVRARQYGYALLLNHKVPLTKGLHLRPICESDHCVKPSHMEVLSEELKRHRKVISQHIRKLKEYGLTHEEYRELLAKQNGVCAICGVGPTKARSLAIDHEHRTKRVRGLLCSKCNVGLGFFEDEPELLLRAASYLTKEN